MSDDFLKRKIEREFRELVPYLKDTAVTDILLNPDGKLWVYRQGDGKRLLDVKLTPQEVLHLLGSIASYAGTVLNSERPLLQASLPWGQRVQGVIPPVVSSPAFAIRNHSARSFKLSDYIASGRMPVSAALYLKQALVKRKNIIVSGGTGSGKTTLTGALLAELAVLCPDDRLCVMEDTRELQTFSPDTVFELSGNGVTMTDLLAVNLRLRPDRIILGEIRGPEALDLLKSWNSGHPGGISTVHANSAWSALTRFEQLVLEAQELNIGYLRSLISDAVDVVVQVERKKGVGPVLRELIEVEGLDERKEYKTNVLYERKDE